MALKRTRVPFYGKREAAFTHLATGAMRSGDRDRANELFGAVESSIRNRFERHLDNGRRKSCHAGKSSHRTPRGY